MNIFFTHSEFDAVLCDLEFLKHLEINFDTSMYTLIAISIFTTMRWWMNANTIFLTDYENSYYVYMDDSLDVNFNMSMYGLTETVIFTTVRWQMNANTISRQITKIPITIIWTTTASVTDNCPWAWSLSVLVTEGTEVGGELTPWCIDVTQRLLLPFCLPCRCCLLMY